MRQGMISIAIVVLLSILSSVESRADGFIVVHPPRPQIRPTPLAVKYHHVDVTIQDQAAVTTIDQVFFNPNNMRLEGTYIFPLPEGAIVSDMSMWIDGNEMKGELLPRDKANQIYTDIVRQMKDPAILEYMGERMFRMRIFPIEPRSEKRVKIKYAETLPVDGGLETYRYPLSTEKFSSAPLNDVTIHVKITSAVPLKTIFSPSHEVDVVRKGDHGAEVGYEAKNVKPDKDFLLYMTLSDERFGANLVTFKETTQDGYFALFVAPRHDIKDTEIIRKDVVFVIDTSGSMKAPAKKPWKIDQAKAALKFCVNSLNEGDRFNIVSFATDARGFRKQLQPVNDDTRTEAARFVDAMEARGGTNIHDALRLGLGMQEGDSDRPFIVVFLTDGQPTVGELQDAKDLVAFARKNASSSTRLFVFGVGYEVNTHLLDKLALDIKGDRMYISPDENIELKVSGFYDKISYPVLSDVRVFFDGVETYDIFPTSVPDLFRGSQLILYGRYSGSGHSAIRLEGKVKGKPTKLVYEAAFPKKELEHEHIPRLWATSKIGYLLDQLRLKGINVTSGQKPVGADKEILDEIVALATEFGIVTPYTALLVLEDSKRLAGPAGPTVRRLKSLAGRSEVSGELKEADEGLSTPTGRGAFRASKEAERLSKGHYSFGDSKDAFSKAINRAETFKQVGKKTFVLENGVWYDSIFKEGETTTKITFLSDEYFELLNKHPRLARYLSVGARVVVRLEGTVYEIIT